MEERKRGSGWGVLHMGERQERVGGGVKCLQTSPSRQPRSNGQDMRVGRSVHVKRIGSERR